MVLRSRLLRLALQDGGGTVDNAVLSFYECASVLPWENSRIVLPPAAAVYRYVLGGNAANFSRLCGIIVR